MRTLGLAWRNILRNRRRSLMTLIAMSLGLTAVLLFGGYIRDINYAMQTDFVRRTGHLQIQHKDYFRIGSGNPAAYGVVQYEQVIAAVRNDPVLASVLTVVTPTLQFGAIAGNFAAGVSRTVFVSGMVVEDQAKMREWNDYEQRIISHPLSLLSSTRNSAIIGTGVARVLQLCSALKVADCAMDSPAETARRSNASEKKTRDEALPEDIAALATSDGASRLTTPADGSVGIEILATNSGGAPNVARVSVISAEFQGIKELDDVHVGLHLPQAQRLVFGATTPQVTAIALQLKHTSQIPLAKDRLAKILASSFPNLPLGIIDYETLNPFYGQTLGMFAAIFGFISVLIGAIVLFTVTNTMSMVVVERTAEIGTLRSIGLRRSGIRAMFVGEGVVLGCFGAVLGIGVAFVLAWAINQLGLTWIPPGRIEEVPLAVRLVGEHSMIVLATLCLVVVAALSALIPSARASRMNIVDALRHV
jgi:putative ABC transport system permease protein